MRKNTIVLSIAGAAVSALVLAGCSNGNGGMSGMDHGGSNSSSSPSSATTAAADFNDADVTFAQSMIMHHQQAIEMSDMLLEKDDVDSQVAELAQRIKDAQQPEIDTMNEWLISWGQPDHDMSNMGDMGEMGGMSQADMDALEAASGQEANSLFLEQMTAHHKGAIEMAQTETTSGQNADAVALAEKIISDQTSEISEMDSLLQQF